MEYVGLLGKTLLSAVGALGLHRLKESLLENLSQRDYLYDLLITQIDQIQQQIKLITSEPYQSALIYLKLGLAGNEPSHFETSLREAIRSFNLASTIKDKCQSMTLAIICLIVEAETRLKESLYESKQMLKDCQLLNICEPENTVIKLVDWIVKFNQHCATYKVQDFPLPSLIPGRCCAVKNKNAYEQCPRKVKTGGQGNRCYIHEGSKTPDADPKLMRTHIHTLAVSDACYLQLYDSCARAWVPHLITYYQTHSPVTLLD